MLRAGDQPPATDVVPRLQRVPAPPPEVKAAQARPARAVAEALAVAALVAAPRCLHLAALAKTALALAVLVAGVAQALPALAAAARGPAPQLQASQEAAVPPAAAAHAGPTPALAGVGQEVAAAQAAADLQAVDPLALAAARAMTTPGLTVVADSGAASISTT